MSNRNKRRRLTAAEMELWQKATANAEKLHLETPEFVQILEMPNPRPVTEKRDVKAFSIGAKSKASPERVDLRPSLEDRLATTPNMDKRNFDRLKKGKKQVEATLDLHGLSLAAAHPRLINFVRDCHATGLRLLLVITGKGRDPGDEPYAERPRGVLRQQVPDWLSRPPLSPLVLQITQAHGKHGGSGAYYVYLRRSR